MSTALLLGGGAPNATLMSGALIALEERGVKFDVISCSGAGSIVGLSYVAPKKLSPLESLKNLPNTGVSDAIFDQFPVNYKVFYKPGDMADMFRKSIQANPFINWIYDQQNVGPWGRLMTDWAQFCLAAMTPTDLSPQSKGMCAPPPFVSEIVDFDKMKDLDLDFYINAYNIDDQQMENFDKQEICEDTFNASLAFPFLYAPYKYKGKSYFEGATKDSLNYKALVEKHPEVDTIVIFDVLGSDDLLRVPEDLYDAWVISIIAPLVAVAKDDTRIFELKHNTGPNKRKLLKIEFDIPKEHLPKVLDWSYSNLKTLEQVGYDAGVRFYEKHKDELTHLADTAAA